MGKNSSMSKQLLLSVGFQRAAIVMLGQTEDAPETEKF
jgi:hypothetical protein